MQVELRAQSDDWGKKSRPNALSQPQAPVLFGRLRGVDVQRFASLGTACVPRCPLPHAGTVPPCSDSGNFIQLVN